MEAGELRAHRDALESLWRQGLSGRSLLQEHTQLIDAYLVHRFRQCPAAAQGMALVALGGYGRSELFPYSDVDIMLLHEPVPEEQLAAAAGAVLYPLWDAGLEVGHGVRTREACLADASEDFFLQVALLDARLLAGSEELFEALREDFRRRYLEGQRHEFLEQMIAHRNKRHQRYGMHSYLLEPHIKESRGGLRDVQAMLWTAQAVFGLQGLDAVEDAGLLTGAERQRFDAAWDQLIRIRNRLHYVSGRKNDRLYFEHQEETAAAFGYRTGEGFLGVEHFMRDVYGHLQTVAITSDLFFEHVAEVLEAGPTGGRNRSLGSGLEIRNGHIHLADREQLREKPHLLMKIFAAAAKHSLPIHHRTRKLVAGSLDLVDDKLRSSKRMARAFLDCLVEAAEPLPVLTAMLETGLLAAYIPEFGAIESLAQHDVYHIFTVDRHLLQTVAELERLRDEEANLFMTVSSPQVLTLAALFHDIGKGSGSGHSERGAELVAAIGRRLGLQSSDIACLSFVVRHHLFLTDTALRRDLEDDQLIIRCARMIKDPDRLTMLYLLAIADARATGPGVWNDWKAALLLELFLKIAHMLEQPEAAAPSQLHGMEWMRARVAEQLIAASPVPLETLPADYLLSFEPEAIARHLELRRELPDNQALVESDDAGDHWSVLIMAHDSQGLLAKICGVVALHNLHVMSALISTWPDATAVDVLHVRPSVGLTFAEQDWQALRRDLNLVLANRLALAHRLVDKGERYDRRSRAKALRPEPRVEITNRASETYTVIEVYAENRPGLLYDITRSLSELAINIYRAKIATEMEQLVDVFYVLDSEGNKIEDKALQEELRQSLLYAATKVRGKV